MEGYRILIVEDHVQSRTTMAEYLRRQEGVALVREAGNGAEALKLLSEEPFEIMITDIIMPQMDGYALLEEMRRRELPSKPQTIVVSALGRDDFVTRAIELGATFYMVKPFDTKEVVARIKAVLRRYSAHDNQRDDGIVKFDNIEISLDKYELKLKGKSVDIPPKELVLLYFLASNYNRVFTRDQLLDKVWGFDYLGDSRTVDVHVKRLREKLEGVSDKWCLKTVWGVGYKFEVTE
mgnify:CR=1 FL=1